MIIPNQSHITFRYVLPDGDKSKGSADSNVVNTEILTYSVPKVKSSDKIFLQEGETAQQTVSVTNNSAADLFGVTFRDSMTDGPSHEPGSVIVNGVSHPEYDPEAGFPLPDLPAGNSATVQYTVRADNPRSSTSVNNFATIGYSAKETTPRAAPFLLRKIPTRSNLPSFPTGFPLSKASIAILPSKAIPCTIPASSPIRDRLKRPIWFFTTPSPRERPLRQAA